MITTITPFVNHHHVVETTVSIEMIVYALVSFGAGILLTIAVHVTCKLLRIGHHPHATTAPNITESDYQAVFVPISPPPQQPLLSGVYATVIPPITASSDDISTSTNEFTHRCCICFERKPRYAIDPCGHLSICKSKRCLEMVRDKCPICMKTINKFIRIFES